VERERALAEQQAAAEEVGRLRQVLDQEAASGRGSETALRGATGAVSSLQRQLAMKVGASGVAFLL
jgi:hypothetical protein